MDRLMENRTAIVITHRLSMLRNCKQLLLIEDGRLVNKTANASETMKDALSIV